MWKPLALASLALFLTGRAAAQDTGVGVAFPGWASPLAFQAQPGGGKVIFDSGESAPLPEAWDSVLIQGESPDPGVTFQFSRRLALGAWGPWTTGTVRRRADGRFWAKARLGPGAGAVRLRAVDASVTSSHEIELYSVEVFDSAEGDAAARSGPKAQASASRPDVHGRAEWGASAPKEAYASHVPARITLHHTATRLTSSLAESLNEVGFIQDFHQNGRGWNDIGYHYLVDALGNVFAGRPESAVGAHVKNNNTGNLGVSMLGYHHAPKNDPVAALTLDSVVALGRAFIEEYGITVPLQGHRDFGGGTSCPGDLGYARVAEIKARLAAPPAPPAAKRRWPFFAWTPPAWL